MFTGKGASKFSAGAMKDEAQKLAKDFGSSINKSRAAMPSFSMSSIIGAYPRKIGDGLAEGLVGNSAFIKDVPKGFDKEHARHFFLVEGVAIMPLYTLSIVHYFSSFCKYGERKDLIVPLQAQQAESLASIHFWLDQLDKKNPTEGVLVRTLFLAMQVVTFPFWLVLATTAPPVCHCFQEHANSILATKYAAISNKSPPFVDKRGRQCELGQGFHNANSLIKTDMVAVGVILFIYYMVYG